MRRLALALAISLVAAPIAAAADALPRFRKDTPYAQVRAQMIRSGFRPLHIVKRPESSGVYCDQVEQGCREYPEAFVCSMTFCDFLFVRRSDGAYFVLVARGESVDTYRFAQLRRASVRDLKSLRDEYVIASPASAAKPVVAKYAPYAIARSQLIAQGYDPVRVVSRGGVRGTVSPCRPAGPDATPCHPELMECGGPAWSCDWLFVRRSDGVLFRVVTHNEGEGWRTADVPRVVDVTADVQSHLEGYIIAKPAQRDPGRGP